MNETETTLKEKLPSHIFEHPTPKEIKTKLELKNLKKLNKSKQNNQTLGIHELQHQNHPSHILINENED